MTETNAQPNRKSGSWRLREIDRLKAENTRLRDALEAAPEPAGYNQEDYAQAAVDWHNTTRKQALRKCIGNDPRCPCQDGDTCHYEGPDAWPIPRAAALRGEQ